MPKGRTRRLRQYGKIVKYCHKRIISRQVMTRAEYETLYYIRNRAVVAVFDNCK